MSAELRKAQLVIVDKVQAEIDQVIREWKNSGICDKQDFDIKILKDGEILKTTFSTVAAVESFVDKEADEIWLYNDKEPYTKLYPQSTEA